MSAKTTRSKKSAAKKKPAKKTAMAKKRKSKAGGPESGRFLAANLRRLRKDAELTIEELAQTAQMSVNYVGSLEKGDVNISVFNLEKLAKALDIQVHELLLPPR